MLTVNKPGHLSDMEMGIIKAHPQVSYEIIEKIAFNINVAGFRLGIIFKRNIG